MTLAEFGEMALSLTKNPLPYILIVLFASIVEVSKIKINPWGALFGAIGKRFNKEVSADIQTVEVKIKDLTENVHNMERNFEGKMEDVQTQLSELERKQGLHEVSDIRSEIMNFASSLGRGYIPSQDKFIYIINQAVHYHNLIEILDLENGHIEIDMKFIKKRYMELLENKELN